jgi:hypothetical protein
VLFFFFFLFVFLFFFSFLASPLLPFVPAPPVGSRLPRVAPAFHNAGAMVCLTD